MDGRQESRFSLLRKHLSASLWAAAMRFSTFHSQHLINSPCEVLWFCVVFFARISTELVLLTPFSSHWQQKCNKRSLWSRQKARIFCSVPKVYRKDTAPAMICGPPVTGHLTNWKDNFVQLQGFVWDLWTVSHSYMCLFEMYRGCTQTEPKAFGGGWQAWTCKFL